MEFRVFLVQFPLYQKKQSTHSISLAWTNLNWMITNKVDINFHFELRWTWNQVELPHILIPSACLCLQSNPFTWYGYTCPTPTPLTIRNPHRNECEMELKEYFSIHIIIIIIIPTLSLCCLSRSKMYLFHFISFQIFSHFISILRGKTKLNFVRSLQTLQSVGIWNSAINARRQMIAAFVTPSAIRRRSPASAFLSSLSPITWINAAKVRHAALQLNHWRMVEDKTRQMRMTT